MVYRATSTTSNLWSKLSVASAFRGNLRDASSLLCIFTTLQRCIFAIFASLNFYNVAYLLRLQNLFCPKQSKGWFYTHFNIMFLIIDDVTYLRQRLLGLPSLKTRCSDSPHNRCPSWRSFQDQPEAIFSQYSLKTKWEALFSQLTWKLCDLLQWLSR